MGVAPDELLGDRLDDVAEAEPAGFLRHAGVKHDLQQQVAELVAQIVEVAPGDRVGDLIGLLDGVRRDGRKILLEVPRAPGPRRAQRRHDLDQPRDVGGGFHGGVPGQRDGFRRRILDRREILLERFEVLQERQKRCRFGWVFSGHSTRLPLLPIRHSLAPDMNELLDNVMPFPQVWALD